MMKRYVIYVEGIDKSGKDTVCAYLIPMLKYRYVVNARGIITQIAYDILYDRNEKYEINEDNAIYVMLDVEKEDWLIRCKQTNEPNISYEKNTEAFEQAIALLQNQLVLFRYNSSYITPYQIAKDVIKNLEKLERGESWTNEL